MKTKHGENFSCDRETIGSFAAQLSVDCLYCPMHAESNTYRLYFKSHLTGCNLHCLVDILTRRRINLHCVENFISLRLNKFIKILLFSPDMRIIFVKTNESRVKIQCTVAVWHRCTISSPEKGYISVYGFIQHFQKNVPVLVFSDRIFNAFYCLKQSLSEWHILCWSISGITWYCQFKYATWVRMHVIHRTWLVKNLQTKMKNENPGNTN